MPLYFYPRNVPSCTAMASLFAYYSQFWAPKKQAAVFPGPVSFPARLMTCFHAWRNGFFSLFFLFPSLSERARQFVEREADASTGGSGVFCRACLKFEKCTIGILRVFDYFQRSNDLFCTV